MECVKRRVDISCENIAYHSAYNRVWDFTGERVWTEVLEKTCSVVDLIFVDMIREVTIESC